MINGLEYNNYTNLASTIVNARNSWLAQDKRQKLSNQQFNYQNGLLDSQDYIAQLDFNANIGELISNSLTLTGELDAIQNSRGINTLDRRVNKNRNDFVSLFNRKAKNDLVIAKQKEAERLRHEQEIKASQAQQRANSTSALLNIAVSAGMMLL